MTKKSYLVAALVGLLVCLTVAWRQDAPTPEYRDVLRGLVGQNVTYHSREGALWLWSPVPGGASTATGVGADFLELTLQDGTKLYIPIGQVILRVTPDK